jgi:hypothetical protein
MAQFKFYVGRKGHEAVACTADAPSRDALLAFKGGTVKITTPRGTTSVDLPSAFDMATDQMTILLQHACRDLVFPPAPGTPTNGGKRKQTGYVD